MEWKILYCCLLLFAIKLSVGENYGRNEDISFIYREIDLLKDENRDQNIQIQLLKEMVNKASQQSGTIHESNFSEEILDPKTKERPHPQKRPARLLPLQLLYNRKNDTNETNSHQPTRFYGPPADCSDLKKLGYTLNGFYLVKPDRNSTLDDENLKTVYCSFKQPGNVFDSSKIEKQVSHSKQDKQSNGGGVHFHAVATYIPYKTVMNSKFKNIFYQETVLNMGEAFDNNTGFFTAPKSGVYKFSFQMTLSAADKIEIVVELYHRTLNDISSGEMGTAVRFILLNSKDGIPFGLIDTTVKLNRGEIIYLHMQDRRQKIIENIYLTNPILVSGSLLV